MSIIDKITGLFTHKESRSSADDAIDNFVSNLEADSYNSQFVTTDNALGIAAVFACVRLISDTFATLPIHIKEKTEQGRLTRPEHPISKLWLNPNPKMSGITLLRSLMYSVLLRGNGYAHISKRDAFYRPIRLDFYLPTDVFIINTDKNDVYYKVVGVSKLIPSRDMIHIKGYSHDGIEGISPLRLHRENLTLTRSAEKFGNQFFSQGCQPSAVFETETTLSDAAHDRLKKGLNKQYNGLQNASKSMLLEGGLKYKQISIPPEDAQFLGTRKFQATEIARIFGVPPHMIADLDKATNNNIEQQSLEFVKYCLRPLIVFFEDEFNRKLLRNDERGSIYHQFNLDALLRGDIKTRSEHYRTMHMIGGMTINEYRKLEDLPPIEGGDKLYVQMNMIPIELAGRQNNKNISNGDKKD